MDERSRDQLTILSISYYVLASLVFMASLAVAVYMLGGLALFAIPAHAIGGRHLPRVFGSLLIAFGGVGMMVGLSYAVLLIVAGSFLARTQRWAFCMAVAVLSCMLFPLGAVLGALTIVVLLRPEVKASFEVRA